MFQAADNLHARLTHELSRHVDPLCAAVLQPLLSYWIMCQCADDPHAVLCRAFAADMFQAADNLHARLTHELSRHVDLLELVEAAQAVGHLMFNMTPAQRRSLGHLQKVWGDRISGAGGGVRSGCCGLAAISLQGCGAPYVQHDAIPMVGARTPAEVMSGSMGLQGLQQGTCDTCRTQVDAGMDDSMSLYGEVLLKWTECMQSSHHNSPGGTVKH